MWTRRVWMSSLAFGSFALGWAAVVGAQQAPDALTSQQRALNWLDQFRQVQVLFHDQDIARLREKLEGATSEQAQQWWEQTAEARAALDSPEWQKTQKWLKEFLKVQAIYSDEEIEQFRREASDAARSSPDKFVDILSRIEAERTRIASGAEEDAEMRQHKLAMVQAYKQEEAAARMAAMRQSRAASVAPNSQRAPVVKDNYRPPSPLVTSMDVARWSVMRNFWGSW